VSPSANMIDEFNVIDLEFRKVELQRLINIKAKELDESIFEREQLKN
jgi:hypothetical protein